MARHYCKPDDNWQTRKDGRPYNTVKPPAEHGLDLARTILMDDSECKTLPNEKSNGLILPSYFPYSHPDFVEETGETIRRWGAQQLELILLGWASASFSGYRNVAVFRPL